MSNTTHNWPVVWRFAAVGAGVVAAVAFAAPAHAAGNVQCGDVITTDVTLSADLFCPGDGLVINGSDLIVDLHGHTIHGSGTGRGIVYADATAPHVDADVINGTITNFGTGIALAEGDTDILIKYVRLIANNSGITGFLLDDIEIRGGEIAGNPVAVAADASTGVVLASVRVTGGVVTPFNGSNHWVIKGCILTDAVVDFAEATDSTIMNSRLTNTRVEVFQSNQITVINNDMIGSHVSYSSGFNGVIRGNRFSQPAGGVKFDTASGFSTVQIERNTFTGNTVGVQVVRDELNLIADLTISYNTFVDNRAAGAFVQSGTAPSGPFTIHHNTFTGNGFASGGLTDSAGRPVNDGLHTNVPLGSGIVVADNVTANNADHGIEALPDGSVVDGGGNTSSGDPAGCAGVVCL